MWQERNKAARRGGAREGRGSWAGWDAWEGDNVVPFGCDVCGGQTRFAMQESGVLDLESGGDVKVSMGRPSLTR